MQTFNKYHNSIKIKIIIVLKKKKDNMFIYCRKVNEKDAKCEKLKENKRTITDRTWASRQDIEEWVKCNAHIQNNYLKSCVVDENKLLVL